MVGTHINRNITWAELAAPFTTCLARSSFMLQQGLIVADLAYLLPEGAPSTMPFWGAGLEPSPPEGYDYDYINTDVLLNLGFTANSNAVSDPGVKVGEIWGRDKKKIPAGQGMSFGRMDVDRLIDRGYGFATLYYGDIDPDFDGGLPFGVRALYPKPGQKEPAPDEWGAIAAWAWGLSRALDYLETDPGVDAKRVAIMGVSRLGKTVLWAGANDTRVALVIASCSGEGGAALSRRNYGETIAHMTAPSRYPYQLCANYGKFADQVDRFPVDAHMLIALMAPRPVLLQTGDRDYWSDPKGEFLAAVAAEPVFRLLGKQGLETDQWPEPGQPLFHTLGYHIHPGGHGPLPSDWDQFLEFMDMHLHPER